MCVIFTTIKITDKGYPFITIPRVNTFFPTDMGLEERNSGPYTNEILKKKPNKTIHIHIVFYETRAQPNRHSRF